jgi:adenosylmethionine-8-amino-7-oxononanoate aminotransferase
MVEALTMCSPWAWVAALVMESILHGAGGMDLIDPLFHARSTLKLKS